jgi:hypothetical protein
MSLIRHPSDFARAQTMIPVSQGHAVNAPSPASHLPSGWWIIPMATLGAAMWYFIITGLFALIG